jgi:hypothetical protein
MRDDVPTWSALVGPSIGQPLAGPETLAQGTAE